MNAVLDTNIVADLVLGTLPFAEEAKQAIDTIAHASAPALWEAEVANAVWMAVRHGMVSIAEAARRIELAAALGIHTVENRTLWQGALVRAHRSNVAVYDALFVELAVRERVPLVTRDRRLLTSFPDVAIAPAAVARHARRSRT